MATAADRPSASVAPGGLLIDCAVQDDRWQKVENLHDLAERAAVRAAERAGAELAGVEISLVFGNDEAIAALNRDYRGRDAATNVLSFPGDLPSEVSSGGARLLGDVVLAFETITREAEEHGKTFENHLCHLIVHGVLHLLGYDHVTDMGAREMEALEIGALALIGVPNPYECNS
jgi:probable rRNA maturation factor